MEYNGAQLNELFGTVSWSLLTRGLHPESEPHVFIASRNKYGN